MRVAVTGGSGFVGSHVVEHLLAAGHMALVLDTRPPHRPDLAFRRVDIADVDGLERAMRGCDAVFHLAAVSDVNTAFADPVAAVAANVTGTTNVWEAARRNDVGRAVLASTVWVYGAADGEEPLDEAAPFGLARTGHIYTATKLAGELVAHSYQALYGQPFTILRYGIPYGPRMRDDLVIARFVRMALAGDRITVDGDGTQARYYVHVADLAAAHVLALGDAAENHVFNLEGDEPVSVRRIVESLDRIVPGHLEVEYRPARAGDYSARRVANDKARLLLGWEPTTGFEEGLRRYVEWFEVEEAAAGAAVATASGDASEDETPAVARAVAGRPARDRSRDRSRWWQRVAAAGVALAVIYGGLTFGVATAVAHGVGVAHPPRWTNTNKVYLGVRLGSAELDDPALREVLARARPTVIVDAAVAQRRQDAMARLRAAGVEVANGGWGGRRSTNLVIEGRADIVRARRTIRAAAGTCCEEFVPARRLNAFDLATARMSHERVVVPARVLEPSATVMLLKLKRGQIYEFDTRYDPTGAVNTLQGFLDALARAGLVAAPLSELH